MSLDYHTYIGPYFECVTSQIDKKSSVKSCTGSLCSKYKKPANTAFCPVCGNAVGEVKITIKTDKVDVDELRESVKERITTPFGCGSSRDFGKNIDLWLPNVGKIGISFDPTESPKKVDINPNIIQEQLNDLLAKFSYEHEILCEAYGNENVCIKWGLVHQVY